MVGNRGSTTSLPYHSRYFVLVLAILQNCSRVPNKTKTSPTALLFRSNRSLWSRVSDGRFSTHVGLHLSFAAVFLRVSVHLLCVGRPGTWCACLAHVSLYIALSWTRRSRTRLRTRWGPLIRGDTSWAWPRKICVDPQSLHATVTQAQDRRCWTWSPLFGDFFSKLERIKKGFFQSSHKTSDKKTKKTEDIDFDHTEESVCVLKTTGSQRRHE